MLKPYVVQVRAEARNLSWAGLLGVVENVVPVKFEFSQAPLAGPAAEIVLLGQPQQRGESAALPSLTVPRSERESNGSELQDLSVRFTDDPEVPFPFQGRSLSSKAVLAPEPLELRSNERVLAQTLQGPVWAVSCQAGVKHFRSAFPLPTLPDERCLHDVLQGERFLEMLPLLDWLRKLGVEARSEGPPLRACFVFDDPNLHWPRYGYVDFREVAEHAAKENYHVAFATIPLDTWFTSQKTAEIFQRNSRWLSLCVHGNDHLRMELARDYSKAQRALMLRQAIGRIERLERAAGLQVSRVMVPPHGACSADMLAELPKYGFEAACISHGSLRAHNRAGEWTRNLGYHPSESIGSCPVLPRWGFHGSVTNTILLASFLNQPIILRGHHQDLRDGIEILDGHARFINSLGPVRWSSLKELSAGNYQWCVEADTFRLKPLGRKLVVQLPPTTARLAIEPHGYPSRSDWQVAFGDAVVTVAAGHALPVTGASHGAVTVELMAEQPVSAVEVPRWPTAKALLRRLLTEGRDRFLTAP